MKTIATLISVVLFMNFLQEKSHTYEWRGKDRKGIYYGSGFLKEWPVEGPKEIRTIEGIGNGFVSPVFTESDFYITGEIDSMAILFCFNLEGKKIWQTTLGKEWMKSYPGARSAPTVVNDMIYAGTGMGNLYCLDRKTGKIIWSKDLAADFKGILPLHGHSESALVDGDKVFWTPGGKEYNVVALNRFTGKLIWSTKGFCEPSAYNSPKLIELPKRKIVVLFTMYHLLGLDVATGQLLWSHEQINTPLDKRGPGIGDSHCNTVLYEDGAVYYAAGDGNGGVKLRLSEDGTKITQVWRNKGFDSFMGGVVKIDNYMFGSGTTKPDIRGINCTTGLLTDSLRIGSGAVIAADDRLYYYTQKGDMMLLGYDQGKIQKISSFRISKGNLQHFSHPVIHEGILYQRHGNVLLGFDIRNNK